MNNETKKRRVNYNHLEPTYFNNKSFETSNLKKAAGTSHYL